MSWLVSEGYVPYRDFFEHHHPLLWYIVAPFMIILPHKLTIAYYFSRIFSLTVSLITLYVIAKIIKRFLSGIANIPYFFILLFMFFPTYAAISTLKPDIFTRLFYFAGLYLFFCYAQTRRTKDLVWSGLAFTVSFLFLQNIIFSILPLFIPILYLWEKEPRTIKDIGIASIAPLTIMSVLALLMHTNDMLTQYFQLNWILNANLFDTLHYVDKSLFWYWIPVMLIGLAAWIYQIKKGSANFYINTIGILFIGEMYQHMYFKAVHNHYFVLMFIFISLLVMPVVANLKSKIAKFTTYISVIIVFVINICVLHIKDTRILQMNQAVQLDENDQLLNINFRYFSIYSPKISYYVMFHAMTLIDNELFNRYPDYDVNKFITKHKIKYIDYVYEELPNMVFVGSEKFDRFKVSTKTLEDYTQIEPGLWKRKEGR